ncbi:MAG: hypothetical protein RI965_2118 [Bacteroidota bacterium]|jgi:hypothetical protein
MHLFNELLNQPCNCQKSAIKYRKVLIFTILHGKLLPGDNPLEKVGKKHEIIFFQFRYFSIIARCTDKLW